MEDSMNDFLSASETLARKLSNVTNLDLAGFFVQCDDVSHDTQTRVEYILDLCISSIFCYTGVINNAVAIVVFIKLGFENTINISLTTIALCDFLKCLSGVISRAYGLFSSQASFYFVYKWKIITAYSMGQIYFFSGNIASCLTAYVALERCLCVSLPFTVKYLLTRKVVICVNVILPVLVLLFHGCLLSIYTLTFAYSPLFNRSVPILDHTSLFYDYPIIDDYSSMLSLLSPTLTWVIMTTSTIIILVFLRKASKVRSNMKQKPEGENKSNNLSTRDRQIIKMLLAGIVVHIITSLPKIIFYSMTYAIPEFRVNGCLRNTFWVVVHVMGLADYVNALANPFIFYFMSSVYKAAFLTMFKFQK